MRTTAFGSWRLPAIQLRVWALVLVIETLGALIFWGFLTFEDWKLFLGVLALMGVLFAFLQSRPAIENRVSAAFAAAPGFALLWGSLLTLGFPFALGSNTYFLHLCIMAQLYAVLALALNFQLGSANIPNFATGASYGIGAYTSALLALRLGWDFWLTLPVAALMATALGFLLGLPSMRTRDSYLALVTIAFGVVVQQLLNNFGWTGGPNGLVGIPAPSLFGHSFADPVRLFGFVLPSQTNFYYLCLGLIAVSVIAARRLHNSRVGLAWNALRADELAARCQGIDVSWYKVLAFAVDAFIAAFAGTVYAFYVGFISPQNFTFLTSVTIMTMVIAGGMDNSFGVIVGAFLLTILPEKFRAFSEYRLMFFGIVVIAALLIRPQGLFPQRPRQFPNG